MMNIVTLTPELAENLQKLADAEHLTVVELIEVMTERYQIERLAEVNSNAEPTHEEIEAVKASILEANKPGAKWHTSEEVIANLNNMTDSDYNEDDEGLEWRM